MTNIVLVNKPYGMLCQFTDDAGRKTLASIVDNPNLKDYYPAGRLDRDSEGLVVLTNVGRIQHVISHPANKMSKTYWVQVEGEISQAAIDALCEGILLKDGLTKPADAKIMTEPEIWDRDPPIRQRKNIPTSWVSLTIAEGRNRQVRRMTAALGFPTLRLIRSQIGPWKLGDLRLNSYSTTHIKMQELQQPPMLTNASRRKEPSAKKRRR